MDVLFLTTIGSKTGQRRQTPVAWFPDGEDAWLIVASAAGSARNPAWYHNLGAHPDQVWIELPQPTLQVTPEQLEGPRWEGAGGGSSKRNLVTRDTKRRPTAGFL